MHAVMKRHGIKAGSFLRTVFSSEWKDKRNVTPGQYQLVCIFYFLRGKYGLGRHFSHCRLQPQKVSL